ncbi:hypothetical protein [Limnoglobus roseus]|uniref:Uncharacterized protein n=1 Tax=Limnoglobus roseus TaxID=2598579 RepID=A0A5C1ARC2_9BACT|nr:hypothetical protein [Limnoglobus roseus]QEL20526.1 hypothetical protein PX52LOC_07631 [Limnoglobus roseus]
MAIHPNQSIMDLGVGVERFQDEKNDYKPETRTMWPTRDHEGQYTGILIRERDGRKSQVKKSRQHFYYADHWVTSTSPAVLFVEGGLSTAGNISAELCVIGRPTKTIRVK